MSATGTRKERERAERRARIVAAARELAETQGWEAVTVRKLADRIEYSQPVLYGHFAGKTAIVGAVAEEGFAELAEALRAAHAAADGPERAFALLARAYLDFAEANPALYDAMFSLATDLPFGPDAPPSLRAGWNEIERLSRPDVGGPDPGARTEVAWGPLHGLVTLARSGRLMPELRERRLEILVAQWLAGVRTAPPA